MRLVSGQRRIAITRSEVANNFGNLIHVATLQLLLVVLESTRPVGRNTRVGFGKHGHQVFQFVRRDWWAHTDFVELGKGDAKGHLVDDGFEDEVLLFLPRSEEVLLLRALYFAGTVLGVDDDVIFLKIHPAIVRVGRVNPTIPPFSAQM